jgi:hypothetical protein
MCPPIDIPAMNTCFGCWTSLPNSDASSRVVVTPARTSYPLS